MAPTSVIAAVANLAGRLAKGFRSSRRLQPPMRRKALFEAMEQRFLLSAETVIPPPPPAAQPAAALEALFDSDAPARLTASSIPVQYTIEAVQAQDAEGQAAAEDALPQYDPSGVTETTPSILQIDPALAKAGDASLNTLGEAAAAEGSPAAEPTAASAQDAASSAASVAADSKEAATNASAGTSTTDVDPLASAQSQTTSQILATTTQASAPTSMSLAAYAAYVQSRPAPSQVIIVDAAVVNYQTLVLSIANFGQTQSDAAPVPASSRAADAQQEGLAEPAAVSALAVVDNDTEPYASAGERADTGPQIQVARYGDIEMIVIDARYDGVEQISDILSPYHGLAAVQVLSHGASGTLRLGTSQINDGKLDQDKARVASWGRALRPGGDILLYGCDVAKGTEG
ncbi:MAG: DUF4347 domain-containing protein, partial [Pseudomonadota bacterium]